MLRVDLEDDRRVEIWTIDRPRVANAIDRATLDEMQAALLAAEARVAQGDAHAPRGIVLCGAPRGLGRTPAPALGPVLASAPPSRTGVAASEPVSVGREVYLSGADLRELEAIPDEASARAFASSMMSFCCGLEDFPGLVVAAIAGDVYGGGCEIITACDLRVAEEGVQLSFRQTRMGVASAWGGTTRLARLVGLGAAKHLLLTGLPCDASEALRIGFVDEVVPVGHARARAIDLVLASAAGAPMAVTAMKRSLREAVDGPRDASLSRELERFVETWSSADHQEALEALREKRPPRFRGR